VTTVEVKSGYGLGLDAELRQLRAIRQAARAHPGRVVATFMGAHAVPPQMRARRAEHVAAIVGEQLPIVASEGLASACDVFCDVGAFTVAESREILEAARGLGFLLKIHADEIAGTGGAELAADLHAVSAEHLLHASDRSLESMAAAGVVAVLLPATAYLLREEPLAARRLRAAGVAMALGTDFNPGSCPCDSLPLAAGIACVSNGLDPDEALAAITLNAAAAVGLAAETGSLETGKRADVVVLAAPSHRHLPYRFGANLARHVIAAGRLVASNDIS
jgi:imidazolonepropionase